MQVIRDTGLFVGNSSFNITSFFSLCDNTFILLVNNMPWLTAFVLQKGKLHLINLCMIFYIFVCLFDVRYCNESPYPFNIMCERNPGLEELPQ